MQTKHTISHGSSRPDYTTYPFLRFHRSHEIAQLTVVRVLEPLVDYRDHEHQDQCDNSGGKDRHSQGKGAVWKYREFNMTLKLGKPVDSCCSNASPHSPQPNCASLTLSKAKKEVKGEWRRLQWSKYICNFFFQVSAKLRAIGVEKFGNSDDDAVADHWQFVFWIWLKFEVCKWNTKVGRQLTAVEHRT